VVPARRIYRVAGPDVRRQPPLCYARSRAGTHFEAKAP
jgi:hypothetical protein